MSDTAKRIAELEKELAESINGYISRKVIKGKERFYLQWTENGKLKSRYIKTGELEQTRALVERRKSLQAELKKLKATPDGVKSYNLKRKAVRNMQNITGTLMSEDRVIATVKNGVITDADERLLPLYLKRTGNIEGWLASRAIDSHRTNSRLLKRALRLRTTDDIATALAVNAATVTDRYWFKPEGSSAVYEDIRFKENYFAELALRGDPDSFSHKPSRTPELTNTGSFEKCWKLIDGEWWMYKSGNKEEYFSELFICKLCEKLGLPMSLTDGISAQRISQTARRSTLNRYARLWMTMRITKTAFMCCTAYPRRSPSSICFCCGRTRSATTWTGTPKTSDCCGM